MSGLAMTRRNAVVAALGGGLLFAWLSRIAPQMQMPTHAVATGSGKLRGLRTAGVSRFLGIPYGGGTAQSRFQPAPPPAPWRGVRDCFAYGPEAPQPGGADESEDCLVLNVFTPDASPAEKRPVMVWLHGGGFSQGSGSDVLYDGSALCREGNVVVVTLNHRLGVLGYLYLGSLSDEFAESGNVGQLDIIQALTWVRDNIAAFGGDPANVTIFGESGGGQKVSTLLAMPRAQGLFHKAIIQSAPGVAMAGKAEAAALAGRLLAALGLAETELHRLQTLGYRDILTAAEVALQHGGVPFEPVVDGISLPENPFTPLAPEISRNVPLIIGTNRDEATLAFIHQPGFADMTAEQASARFTEMLGARGAAAFALYRDLRPHDPPGYWVTALVTDRLFRMNAITLAERKAAQGGANVYMYRLDWPTPVEGGRLRTPHTLDIPLVFDNVNIARGMVGPGPRPRRMASIMSRAWAGFAHTGNPSQPSLAWPCYDAEKRLTMIFDLPSEVSSDPGSETRRFWSG